MSFAQQALEETVDALNDAVDALDDAINALGDAELYAFEEDDLERKVNEQFASDLQDAIEGKP